MKSTRFVFQSRLLVALALSSAFCLALLPIQYASAAPRDVADEILEESGVAGGLVVHLGCGDGRLTAALMADERYLVQGLDTDADAVRLARETLQAEGLYGRVSVDTFDGRQLPYLDSLVNLLVAEDLGRVARSEAMRVLAPGGVLAVKQNGRWTKTAKPWPEDIDDWSHYLHDSSGNAVAADRQVGPPKHVRWVGGPLWSRSHEFNPSINSLVSASGRMFYILDEGMLGLPDLRFPSRWSLCARDAFSGVFLWKVPVPNWGYREWNTRGMWSAPLTLNRRVVTDGRRVFATLGYNAPVTVLDPADGHTISTIEGSRGTDEMLLCDGVLLLSIPEKLSVAPPIDSETLTKRRRNPGEFTIDAPGAASIVAVDAASGRQLWKRPPEHVTVLTLAAQDGRVCFLGSDGITCLDLANGKQQWTTPCQGSGGTRGSSGTLVMHDGVVLFTGKLGIAALSAADGDTLWTGPPVSGPGISHPPDLFVADGLVWGGDIRGSNSKQRTAVRREGYDVKTGEVRRTIEVPFLFSPLHHVRCYRSKATERFLLLTKRGIEFLDVEGEDHSKNDWLRAMCHYGFMPANGLLYVPPHHCFCYPGVKMKGFLALSAEKKEGEEGRGGDEESAASRLQRGPAFNPTAYSLQPTASFSSDWPTYRGDPLRSGHTKTSLPTEPEPVWKTKIGGRVSPPVVAGDKVYVAAVDKHQVCCLEATTGRVEWKYTAGGRVDSPPTIHRGLVLFGCGDGWVYSLRATDGQLVWRFRAAPEERRIVSLGQVESPWPVPGSVLVLDDVAYVSCGRSSFLDGGVYLYGLKPESGELLHQTCVKGPWPDVQTETGHPFDMEGVKSDVLVTDGVNLFLYQMTFDKELNDLTAPRASSLGDRVSGRRLIATGGFLEDVWYDRTFWTYSKRWPGFYYANDAPKAGQILVFDDRTTYGLHVFTERLRLSPAFTPGGEGYELFADDNDNEPILAESSIDREKGPGFSRAEPPKWSQQIPLRAMAMLLADDKLFMAGPPDTMPEDDPYASFEGRLGTRLMVCSTTDGKTLFEGKLDEAPVFDGFAAAGGRLFMSTADGSVVSLGIKR